MEFCLWTPSEVSQLVKAVQSVLSPELLSPKWRRLSEGQHPLFGHCYAASEAVYYLAGGADALLTPQVARTDVGTHWWLEHSCWTPGCPHSVIDPTAAQFPYGVDYATGRGCGFLTKGPSRRAQLIIDAATADLPDVCLGQPVH